MSKALQQLVEHIDLRAINNKQEPPLEGDQQDDVLGDELDTEFWIKVSFVKCTQRKNSSKTKLYFGAGEYLRSSKRRFITSGCV